MLRYLLDQFREAEAALRTACEKAPRNYQFRMTLALLQEKRYELTGDDKYFNEAIKSIEQLHKLDPADVRAKQIFQELLQMRQAKDAAKERRKD